jgi:hypothetical protein
LAALAAIEFFREQDDQLAVLPTLGLAKRLPRPLTWKSAPRRGATWAQPTTSVVL